MNHKQFSELKPGDVVQFFHLQFEVIAVEKWQDDPKVTGIMSNGTKIWSKPGAQDPIVEHLRKVTK